MIICPRAFGGFFTNGRGIASPCCMISPINDQTADTKIYTIDEVLNSASFKKLRSSMLCNNELPTECHRCKTTESAGGTSVRQFEFNVLSEDEIKSMIDMTSSDGTIDTSKYFCYHYETKFGETVCNFKCRTCNEVASSSIRKEKIKLGIAIQPIEFDVITTKRDEFSNRFINDFKAITIAGGEPFLSNEFYEFINGLKSNTQLQQITVYTNGSIAQKKYQEVIEAFDQYSCPKCELKVSIDGIGTKGEYVRNGMNWDSFKSNISYFCQSTVDHNVRLIFAFTTSAFSITNLIETLDYLDSTVLCSTKVFLQYVTNPSHTSIAILPKHILMRMRAELTSLKFKNLAINRHVDLLKYIDMCIAAPVNLNTRKQFIDEMVFLDSVRNEDFKSTFEQWYVESIFDERFLTDINY